MLSRQRGFTLLETLIAMLISSLLLLAAVRLLPALQRSVLQQSKAMLVQQDLWQVAFTIGKHIQRAGYCRDDCQPGLLLIPAQHCLIIWWRDNSNGNRHDNDFTGYRWRGASIETRQNVPQCDGTGWEKITDPQQLKIRDFQVRLQPRTGLLPLVQIDISASLPASQRLIHLRHTVVAYNL